MSKLSIINYPLNNRAFLYGDAFFDTLKVLNGKILFYKDHYLRIIDSMRLLKMEVPPSFTMDFLENEILSEVKHNKCTSSARVRITFYRDSAGLYLPETNNISYLISAEILKDTLYICHNNKYVIDIYDEFQIPKSPLSTIKTTNKITNVTSSIYAKEHNLDNCIFLNQNKKVVETINGNIFIVKDNVIKTPPISEGCINGIMRRQVLQIAKEISDIDTIEDKISTSDIITADEIFITNVIKGIIPATNFRNKLYSSNIAHIILRKLNEKVQLAIID